MSWKREQKKGTTEAESSIALALDESELPTEDPFPFFVVLFSSSSFLLKRLFLHRSLQAPELSFIHITYTSE